MEIVREGRYLRPLLRVRRAEIEKYAHQRSLCYREDPSNRDSRFFAQSGARGTNALAQEL